MGAHPAAFREVIIACRSVSRSSETRSALRDSARRTAASCSETRFGAVPPGTSRAEMLSAAVSGGRSVAKIGCAAAHSASVRSANVFACGDAVRHELTGGLVGFAERDAASRQKIGGVGGEGEVGNGGVGHAVRSPAGGANHGRQHVERGKHGVDRVEERLFVFLKVLVVGERQSLGDGEHRHQVAIDAAGLAACQLGDVRVLLLRHDRAAGGERVGKLQKPELGGSPEDDFLRQS